MTARRATRRGERIKIEIKTTSPPTGSKSCTRRQSARKRQYGTCELKAKKKAAPRGGKKPSNKTDRAIRVQYGVLPYRPDQGFVRDKGKAPPPIDRVICAKDDCQKTARLARRSRTKSSGLMAENLVYIGGESESDPEQSRDEYGSYANQNDRPRRHQLPFRVSPPPLALGVFMQSSGGKRFIVVRLGYHAPLCADASPLLHEQDAAEKVRLHAEPVEAVHIARRIDAAKMHGVHDVSLAIVQPDTRDRQFSS